MKKKLIPCILTIAVMLFALTGCGIIPYLLASDDEDTEYELSYDEQSDNDQSDDEQDTADSKQDDNDEPGTEDTSGKTGMDGSFSSKDDNSASDVSKPETEETVDSTSDNTSSGGSYIVQDLYGNDVDIAALISGNKVTLINIWGTFCGPCINEMPDLADLYKEYQSEGFCIIGFTCDVLDENDNPIKSAINDGIDILSYTGVTYPVIRENMELQTAFETSVVPTSFFVDSQGNMLSETYYGSKSRSEWESLIKEMLDKTSK